VGSAVRRNRAKRRLREALAVIPLRDDRDYVVVAAAIAADAPFEELIRWLRRATTEED
jgi:ribonuclease P protein component